MKWQQLLLPLQLLVLHAFHIGHVRCQLQCNAASSSRQKRIVIHNPAARQLSELDSCQYEVAPWSPQVCQVRIDFERLELPQPHLNASSQRMECIDFMQVQRFQLCGRNNGQHLYVQLLRGQTLKLHFKLGSRSTQSTWQLTIMQLECPEHVLSRAKNQQTQQLPQVLPTANRPMLPFLNNLLPRTIFMGGNSRPGLLHTLMPNPLADLPLLAPMGCDQYFRGSTGGIVSFNFAGGAYMPNMKYVICVAGGANQQITYSIEHFALSKSSGAPGAGYDSDCHSTVSTWGRASDYLLIPNSYVANNQAIQATYYCGTGLAGTKIIARPPFVLHFSSDGQTSATETGFQLTYTVQQSQALL
ncbi:uncharacterized protein LOC6562359 isoform X1 [Drosophila grimshawi]|nr:uncharacterized protein LOC6562359 isoform X1 [Drosophila grimshawi]